MDAWPFGISLLRWRIGLTRGSSSASWGHRAAASPQSCGLSPLCLLNFRPRRVWLKFWANPLNRQEAIEEWCSRTIHRSTITVLQNVAFGLECAGISRKERESQAREWIAKVGLEVARDANKYPHQLSGGMRQRVAIARTLALGPKIILMDEPFGALDPFTRFNMQDQLVKLWREREETVFFVTHSVEEAVYLGDRVYVLSPGPGTLVREIPLPGPDRPAREMQREKSFMETVYGIRDIIEKLEASRP
jgi:ABC-type dipeptide/oligopeptide/nickel transport system ATPase subunit